MKYSEVTWNVLKSFEYFEVLKILCWNILKSQNILAALKKSILKYHKLTWNILELLNIFGSNLGCLGMSLNALKYLEVP